MSYERTDNYRLPKDATVQFLASQWQYLSVVLNANGIDCVVDGRQRTTLNALGAERWEVVSVWQMPGGMMRALLKREVVG